MTSNLHDLVPYGSFAVITGITGRPWAEAAASLSAELGIAIEPIVIGPGERVNDLCFMWHRVHGIEEDGVAARPDKHIAFRAGRLAGDAGGALRAVLERVLSRRGSNSPATVHGQELASA